MKYLSQQGIDPYNVGTQSYSVDVGSGITTALGHSSRNFSALAHSASASAVPEPFAPALFGIGAVGIGVLS